MEDTMDEGELLCFETFLNKNPAQNYDDDEFM